MKESKDYDIFYKKITSKLREKEDIRNTDYKNEDIIVELKEGYLITDKDENNE